MFRRFPIVLTFAAAMWMLAGLSQAENPCGSSAMTLAEIDTAQVHVWQGETLEGNASTAAGVYLTPFSTGPVDAIVNLRIAVASPTGVNIPLLLAVSDGRGNSFFAREFTAFLFGATNVEVAEVTFRVTSPQLYIALWTESGTPVRYFTGRTKLNLQPRVCDPGLYRAKIDVDSTSGGTIDGSIELKWEIPSTSGFIPFPPTCRKLDKSCLTQVDRWIQLWRQQH